MRISVLRLVLTWSALVWSFAASGLASADPPKQKQPFEISAFRSLIDSDLGIPKPTCSLSQMGIPEQKTTGILIDHAGKPLAGVAVAIDEPVGYTSHCYFDNFDTTDERGRFSVSGSVRKNRLIFKKANEQLYVVRITGNQRQVTATWPQPILVTLNVPESVAAGGETLTLRSQRYWAGMSPLQLRDQVSDDGIVRFDNVLPGDYFATVRRVVQISGAPLIREVEVAAFSVEPGEPLEIDCHPEQGTRIAGDVTPEDNAKLIGNRIPQLGSQYISIERPKILYQDVPTTVDLLKPAKDGFFLSRPLPPGKYVIRLMLYTPGGAGPFVPIGDQKLREWFVDVEADSKRITLEESPTAISPVSEVAAVIAACSQPTGRHRPRINAERIKASDDREAAELELLRLLKDPTTESERRRTLLLILAELADSKVVVDGLLDLAAKPPVPREQGDLLRPLQTATARIDKIVAAMENYSTHENHITRAIAARVLGMVAATHPEVGAKAATVLQIFLTDEDEQIRLTAADFLGRISNESSISDLEKCLDDKFGPVAVMSGLAIWKINGDPASAFQAVNDVLSREGLKGKWEAAYFLKDIAAMHDVPDRTRELLKQVADTQSNEPSTYGYEIKRAARAAQQILDSLEK